MISALKLIYSLNRLSAVWSLRTAIDQDEYDAIVEQVSIAFRLCGLFGPTEAELQLVTCMNGSQSPFGCVLSSDQAEVSLGIAIEAVSQSPFGCVFSSDGDEMKPEYKAEYESQSPFGCVLSSDTKGASKVVDFDGTSQSPFGCVVSSDR